MWRRFVTKALGLLPVLGRTQSQKNSVTSKRLIIAGSSDESANVVKVTVSKRRQNPTSSKPSATVCRSNVSTKTEAFTRTPTPIGKTGHCSSGRCGLRRNKATEVLATSLLEKFLKEKPSKFGLRQPSDSRAAVTHDRTG